MTEKAYNTNPSSHSVYNRFPIFCVAHDNFSALCIVVCYSHLHNIFWAFDPKRFVNFIFNRKAMCVPPKAPLNMKAILVGVPCYNIFNCSGQNVSIMRKTSSKWRTIIKGISLMFITANNSLKRW